MNQHFCYMDATELAQSIRSKKLSPVEVVEAHLQRIETVNPKLNAIVVHVDDAMDRAREAEQAVMRGDTLGPLHGVPVTVKDCVDTVGLRTTRGSMLFRDRVPEADATVVTRLKDAGAIMVGKTNMPEFALWWETDNLVFGRTENPWKEGRTPGGSSGGEAAAISAGLSPLGVGSDVGGSIREPAAYCGIVGLKATHGRVPLTGHWPEALLRFMHVGPMARTVRDVALGLSVMAGPDGLDSFAVAAPPPGLRDLEGPLPRLRIGWFAEGPWVPIRDDVQQTVTKAATAFEELGCEVEPVSMEAWARLPATDISGALFTAEGGQYLAPIIAGREDELAPSMQRRLKLRQPSLDEYLEARRRCDQLQQETALFFSDYDLLLCPAGPVPAHPHDSIELEVGDQKLPGRSALRATIPADLTGSPAISVPFGRSQEGLPIGVQLIGRHLDEATVLRAASALEGLTSLGDSRPPV